MDRSEATEVRLFARRLAKELTADELNAVSGGMAPNDHCFVCENAGGHDTKVYDRD